MKKATIILCAAVLALVGCKKDKPQGPLWNDEWQNTEPVEKPEDPSIKGKGRYLWVDASANFQYFANDEARIASDLKKIAEMGFTDVIVDVRPTEAVVLYKSKVAPEAKKLAAWLPGGFAYVTRSATFDYLQAFIDHGHECGLRVNAAINTFVGGYRNPYGLGDVGPIFDGKIPSDWATVINSEDGLRSTLNDAEYGARFLNPANDDVQEYVLKILDEIASYDVDGIILDRCRYDDFGLQSDFSEVSRMKFEEYIGAKVSKWPGDIFPAGTSSLPSMNTLRKQWLAFRAKTIHDFIEKASERVHKKNQKVRFGVYVGAWYSTYYYSGVNWASPKYNTAADYKWANSDYKNYGFADHCDFMMLGCYAGTGSVYGNGEWTMEGFCKQGRKLLCGDTVFAGGPDIGNGSGFENGGQSAVIPKTIDACINAADGYFCFDLCHIRMYDYWSAFQKGFSNYLNTL